MLFPSSFGSLLFFKLHSGNIAMENGPVEDVFQKWWLSIAMLVHQRVFLLGGLEMSVWNS